MKKGQKGFTLIELLLVIAIIGILAAIAVPRFGTAQADAEKAACQANQKLIIDAIERYNLKETTAFPAGTDFDALAPDYLRTVPACKKGFYTYTLADATTTPATPESLKCSVAEHNS